jgi:hypothetical protein
MSPLPPSQAEKIAALNDRFRTTLIGGQILLTEGVGALADEVRAEILLSVATFHDFNEDNDPYGEHDFGAIDHAAAGRVLWKIDYYAPDLMHGSEDPADPDMTKRVLTIMLASEY